MGSRASASWGARIGSVALMVVGGGIAAAVLMGAAAHVARMTLMMLRTDLSHVGPALVLLVVSAVVLLVVAVAAGRLSGAGALVAGLATLALAVLSVTGVLMDWLISARPGRIVMTTAFSLLYAAALAPVAATLLGLSAASLPAARRASRTPGLGALASLLVAVAAPVVLLAVTWAGSNVHLRSAEWVGGITADLAGWYAALAGLCLLFTVVVALGGWGRWGLVVAGAVTFAGSALFPLLYPRVGLGVEPLRQLARIVDVPSLATTPVVGCLMVGYGLGLVWRRHVSEQTLLHPGGRGIHRAPGAG